MNITKILVAGLIGGVVAFILGFLLYGVLLSDFFASNGGSATGVDRGEDMLWIPMVLGHLGLGMLFAVIYGRWANISTLATGAKAGAVLGFLIGFSESMIGYGSTNVTNLTGAIVDIVIVTIVCAIVGGVVAWFLGRNGKG